MFLTTPIPCDALRRLEFLLGSFSGVEMMYPPDQPPIHFEIHSEANWETCERYIRYEIFCRASTSVYESLLGMIGYDADHDIYRMWTFARSQSEPMYFSGCFKDESLVLVSEPSPMVWGMQKLRYLLTPSDDDGYNILGEYWTPEGWQKYCTARLMRED